MSYCGCIHSRIWSPFVGNKLLELLVISALQTSLSIHQHPTDQFQTEWETTFLSGILLNHSTFHHRVVKNVFEQVLVLLESLCAKGGEFVFYESLATKWGTGLNVGRVIVRWEDWWLVHISSEEFVFQTKQIKTSSCQIWEAQEQRVLKSWSRSTYK